MSGHCSEVSPFLVATLSPNFLQLSTDEKAFCYCLLEILVISVIMIVYICLVLLVSFITLFCLSI